MQEKEYIVEKVTGKKEEGGKIFYRIKWKGWESQTWEAAEKCTCAAMIADFEEGHHSGGSDKKSKNNTGSGKKPGSGKKSGESGKKAKESGKKEKKKEMSEVKKESEKKKKGRPAGSKKREREEKESEEEEEESGSEYEVEDILDERGTGKRKEYLIKWVGWPNSDATWQSEADCEGCTAVLQRWEKKVGKGSAPVTVVPRKKEPKKEGKKKAKSPAPPAPESASKKKGLPAPSAEKKRKSDKDGIAEGRARHVSGESLQVEEVVAKRRDVLPGGQVQILYLVEWKEEPHLGERSWAREQLINCPALIKNFEAGGKSKRLLKSILGAKVTLSLLNFLCCFLQF